MSDWLDGVRARAAELQRAEQERTDHLQEFLSSLASWRPTFERLGQGAAQMLHESRVPMVEIKLGWRRRWRGWRLLRLHLSESGTWFRATDSTHVDAVQALTLDSFAERVAEENWFRVEGGIARSSLVRYIPTNVDSYWTGEELFYDRGWENMRFDEPFADALQKDVAEQLHRIRTR